MPPSTHLLKSSSHFVYIFTMTYCYHQRHNVLSTPPILPSLLFLPRNRTIHKNGYHLSTCLLYTSKTPKSSFSERSFMQMWSLTVSDMPTLCVSGANKPHRSTEVSTVSDWQAVTPGSPCESSTLCVSGELHISLAQKMSCFPILKGESLTKVKIRKIKQIFCSFPWWFHTLSSLNVKQDVRKHVKT